MSQLALFNAPVPTSAYDYASRSSGVRHGFVLTKPHVVELILDVAGYISERQLCSMRLLEPACGEGVFVVAAVRRLLAATSPKEHTLEKLAPCIVAYDIDERNVECTRAAVVTVLLASGLSSATAGKLAKRWVQRADFLLADIAPVDVVVGNPPYIRIEELSPLLHREYRARYATLFDRADLYIAFIERGLGLLRENGKLSFVCADRWTLNKYGAPLRKLIADQYAVTTYIDLHHASPFESEVIAYPSIFCFARATQGPVPVVVADTADEAECEAIAKFLRVGADVEGVQSATYDEWFVGAAPWTLSSPAHVKVLRDLESKFQPISDTTRVGIGVASGCDRVFILEAKQAVESSRLVPLVMRDNIEQGRIGGKERFVLNVFDDSGSVVDLAKFPRLAAYLKKHESIIRARHVAKKNPNAWFRTIDRVYPDLVAQPKLLIPDIAGANEVAFDAGAFHPHHNLYFVVSELWDLEVLGGLLSSKVALFFVWSYAVKMRGGYLRFQAQYLRRIRVPAPEQISTAMAAKLKASFRKRDFATLDALAVEVYGLGALPEFDFVDTRR